MNTDAISVENARAYFATAVTGWDKPEASGGQNGCFEFNFDLPGWVGVRDSKLGMASPVLAYNKVEFDALITDAKAGRFDNRIR